ncbi:MAG: hypothetical protein N2511_06060 [Thermodesulfovibrionales bacterium]|nr:hypothetical protein [Thermodesulfovibrionales bacterium]
MKSIKFLRFLILILLTFSTSLAFAQREIGQKEVSPTKERPWVGSGGWGVNSQFQRMYDPTKVETISGKVLSTDRTVPNIKGITTPGIHLQLKTEKETITVHLGPAWYIERQDIKIGVGDSIEVKGSPVSIEGQPAIIAAEVRKDDKVLILRDSTGFPVWAGWRKR